MKYCIIEASFFQMKGVFMMTDLVIIQNKQAVTSSRIVAEKFGKLHKTVLRNIKEILAAQNCATKFFKESYYINRGKKYIEYFMNRDGFMLLVMGFTGKTAMDIKIAYINAFNEMETKLKELQNSKMVLVESKYVCPALDDEFMEFYDKSRGYVEILNELLPMCRMKMERVDHAGLMASAFIASSRLTKAIQDMQYLKLPDQTQNKLF